MTLIQKTIAASGADYTSLSLAEASIPNASADDFEFTYVEALDDTTPVTFSVTAFLGTVVVDVQAAYRAEGAVSGAHAQLNYAAVNATNTLLFSTAGLTVLNLRIIRSGATDAGADVIDCGAVNNIVIDRCTVVGNGQNARLYRALTGGTGRRLLGCFFVSQAGSHDQGAIFLGSSVTVMRCCVFLSSGSCTNGLIQSNGVGTAPDVRETLVLKASGATSTQGAFFAQSSGTWSGNCEANGSYTTDTPENTTANESLDPADVFQALTVGSEDLHYPTRAAMLALQGGSDLSATTGSLDIDGETIAEWYPGADYVPAAVAAATGRDGPRGHDRDRGTL